MQYIKWLKNISAIVVLASLLVMPAVVLLPARTYAAGSDPLCHDVFAGVTYTCPSETKEKVDGKAGGKFESSKCYVYSDPNKGWQVASCNASMFTDATIIPEPVRKGDDAIKNDCPPKLRQDGGCDLIKRYFNPLITFLTIAVGLIVTISIVIGGIQYATARNNPQAISAAKTRITNAILAFLAYSLLWGFLQWLVPGGFLNG